MNWLLIGWTVLCVGIGLIFGSDRKEDGEWRQPFAGLGLACILWALGLGIAIVVGAVT